jgi:hypothetical protein
MHSTNRRRARASLSARSLVLAFLILSAAIGIGSTARGAELSVDAPDSCVDPTALADEVSDLIGKPLASVADVDFRIQISQMPQRRWRLRLEMLAQGAASKGTPELRGSRTIEAGSCAELAEAAAVAISVSIRSIAEVGAVTPALAPTRAEPPAGPPPLAAVVTSAALPPAPAPPTRWHPGLALALVTDTGVLPDAGVGLEIDGRLQRGSLRLVLLGAWFASQDEIGSDGSGGRFQLADAGALACFAPRRGRWTPLACGGVEVGRLAGSGLEVARPQTGAAAWEAARAELGLDAALSTDASVFARVGAAVARTRPEFVLDGVTPVYRPGRFGARLALGFELGF